MSACGGGVGSKLPPASPLSPQTLPSESESVAHALAKLLQSPKCSLQIFFRLNEISSGNKGPRGFVKNGRIGRGCEVHGTHWNLAQLLREAGSKLSIWKKP